MRSETLKIIKDALKVSKQIQGYRWKTFKELEILLRKESNILQALMLVTHRDLTTRNPRYLH